MMSTLGAQARAAELAAAVIAKKRMQAIQEMEEQALAQRIATKPMDAMVPPKNPSVSLEAFMKPAPINRNKGPKAWKALDMGSFEDRSDEDNEVEKTDKTESRAADSGSKTSAMTPDSNYNPDEKQSSATIPNGPRVMRLNMTSRTTPQPRIPIAVPTAAAPPPPKLVPPASIAFTLPTEQAMLRDTTLSNTCHPIQFGPKLDPHRPSHVTTPILKPSDCYMVPDDLSPTKQENKLNSRKSQKDNLEPPLPNLLLLDASYQNEQRTESTQYLPSYGGPSGSFVESPQHYQQYHRSPLEEGLLGWDGETTYRVNAPFHGFQGFGNDGYVNSMRSTQLTNIATDHVRQNPQTRPQPYDTKAAMQKFLADQAERSKTDKGKTVLCNPDLYNNAKRASDSIRDFQAHNNTDRGKNKSFSLPVPQKQIVSPSKMFDPFETPKRNFSEPVRYDQVQSINTSLSKVSFDRLPSEMSRSSVQKPQTFDDQTTAIFDKTRQTSSGNPTFDLADRPLGQGKDIPASFYELGPITASERKRTQTCMANAAKTTGANPNNKENEDPLTSNSPTAREHAIASLFSADARGQASLRVQARSISVKHALDRRARFIASVQQEAEWDVKGREQPHGFTLGVDDGLVAGLALGDVACNLQGYLAGDEDDCNADGSNGAGDTKEKPSRDSTFFNRVRGVPEWCTERVHPNVQVRVQGQGLTERESGEGHSYFGRSWGTPPVRVARDPRFTRSDIGSVGMSGHSGIGVGVGGPSGRANMASASGNGNTTGNSGADHYRVRGLAVNGMGREMEQLGLQLERRRLLEAQMGRRGRGMGTETGAGIGREVDREGMRTVM